MKIYLNYQKPNKLNKEVKQRQCENKGAEHRHANDGNKSTLIERVDHILQTFSWLSHFLGNW